MSSFNCVSPVQLTRIMPSNGSHDTTPDITPPTLQRTSSIAVESSPLTRTPSSVITTAAGYLTPPPLQRTPSSVITTTADHNIISGEPSHTNEVCRTLFRFYGEGDIPEEYGGSIGGDSDTDDEEHMNQLAGIVYNINDEDFNNININDGDFNINNMTDNDINYMNNINNLNDINNMTADDINYINDINNHQQ